MITLVRASSLYGYDTLAQELGVDGRAALKRVGLSLRTVRDPDALIPHAAVVELLEYTAHVANCPDVGLRLASRQGLGILGPVFALIRHASTVGDALALASRYLFVHSPALRLSVIPVKGRPSLVDLCFELDIPGLPASAQTTELSLALLAEGIRLQGQGQVRPTLVQLPHARLAPRAQYAAVFGCECRFDAPVAAMRIAAADLQRPLPDHDPLMQDLTQRYLDQHFSATQASMREQVRTLVRRALGSGDCSRDAVARMLGLHPRSLQRRLQGEDARFEDILTTVRREQLQSLLGRDESIPLSQITLMLGYSEQSALTRSCQRWFGCSPSALRGRLRAESS